MEITKEFLQDHIAQMQAQIAAYTGALQFAESLIERLDQKDEEMTVDEFAEMVGGNGATGEIIPLQDDES